VDIAERDPVEVVERELGREFGGLLPDVTIAMLAEQEVAMFVDAKIRDFVPLLARRRAQARARELMAVRSRP